MKFRHKNSLVLRCCLCCGALVRCAGAPPVAARVHQAGAVQMVLPSVPRCSLLQLRCAVQVRQAVRVPGSAAETRGGARERGGRVALPALPACPGGGRDCWVGQA